MQKLPTEEDGTLLLSTVTAQFPGASGLKFKSATGSTRGLRLLDGAFHPPPGTGWDNINFMCVFPKASTAAGSSRISLVRSIDLLEQQPTVTSRTTEAEDEIRLAAADQYRRQQQRRQRAIISDPTVSSTTTAEEDDARYEADRRRRQQDETR
ncbi:hypothetical protein M8J77_003977 [Diaphorina citri]|nr:hypothetical protein M8J77_003977 [Diaphorina citri]